MDTARIGVQAVSDTAVSTSSAPALRVRRTTAGSFFRVAPERWAGELAVDVGSWPAGTRLAAWCVWHYRLRNGLIVSIEQHDCYEQPVPPS